MTFILSNCLYDTKASWHYDFGDSQCIGFPGLIVVYSSSNWKNRKGNPLYLTLHYRNILHLRPPLFFFTLTGPLQERKPHPSTFVLPRAIEITFNQNMSKLNDSFNKSMYIYPGIFAIKQFTKKSMYSNIYPGIFAIKQFTKKSMYSYPIYYLQSGLFQKIHVFLFLNSLN